MDRKDIESQQSASHPNVLVGELMLSLALKRKIKRWSMVFFLALSYWLVGGCSEKTDKIITEDHIAKVTVSGVIESVKQPWYAQLKRVFEDDHAVGLVLVLDSPGGVVHVAESGHDLLQRIHQKNIPIVAVVNAQATSAAYLLASVADKIVANETSIVGSIGVKSSITIFKDMLAKIGVQVDTDGIGEGLTQIPFSGISDFTKKYLDLTGKDSYDWFKFLVKKNRKLDNQRLQQVVGGKIFTGKEGLKLGLVDFLGDLQSAYSLLQNVMQYRSLPIILDYATLEA
ncbi:MAG: S49 family peptidase [Pseudomonadota bacterium]|nr:S49 family peptidase [Pseudomonadota bacterium]